MSGITGKNRFALIVVLAVLCLLPLGASPMIILVLTDRWVRWLACSVVPTRIDEQILVYGSLAVLGAILAVYVAARKA